MIQKYKRLALGSATPENIARYKAKLQEWELHSKEYAIANSENRDTIKAGSGDLFEIIELGKINTQPMELEFGKIQTDDIIITNERVEHIKANHPQDYQLFEKYGTKVLQEPDVIIKDCKNTGTVFMVKRIEKTNLNVIVRVVLESENGKLKNSVMTFYRIRDKNLFKLEKNNKILYKKE